jgi:glucan phosphorylase
MKKQEAVWAIELLDKDTFQQQIKWHIIYNLGNTAKETTTEDLLSAVTLVLRIHIIDAIQKTKERRIGKKEEASGTVNMKLALNGALTIDTLDGANIEIKEEVGAENIFIFGLNIAEVELLRAKGYDPMDLIKANPKIKRVVEALAGDEFCPEQPRAFRMLYDHLTVQGDYYLHLADSNSYIKTQTHAVEVFTDRRAWVRKSILNVAQMSKFSSDNPIAQYAKEIWNVHSSL